MAKLEEEFRFTGRVGNLSAYKMKGVDGIVVRRKGGPSKEQFETSPKLQRTRENAAEFGQCTKGSSAIYRILFALTHVADYNVMSELNKKTKTIQHLDTQGSRGQRSIYYSRHRYLLEGFSLNKKYHFDNVVAHPLKAQADRETGHVAVQLPALLPPFNLSVPWQHPFFRFTLCFGAIADRIYEGVQYNDLDNSLPYTQYMNTEWTAVRQPFAARRLEMQLNYPAGISDQMTLILAAGVEMGTPIGQDTIEPVKYAGCGKILLVS